MEYYGEEMIFLSHTHADKPIVDVIAQRLSLVFGQEKIFYDSWSIQPGDGIIDKMNIALQNCKYFFFFVSKKSLQSNMVKLEWQNALFKSTKEQIKIFPVKIDESMMPAILLQTLYVDIFGDGLETAIRQIVDVISGNNTYRKEAGFHNVRAHVKQCENSLIIEFRAEVYTEPHSRYLILLNNSKDEIAFKAVGENQYDGGFQEQIVLDNGKILNAVILGRQTATSPGFPFIVELTVKDGGKIEFFGAMRTISREKFECIPIVGYPNN